MIAKLSSAVFYTITRKLLGAFYVDQKKKGLLPSTLPSEHEQWGIIQLKNGKGTISLPISAEILFCVLQHYGITPQCYGCNGKSVVGTLKDDDTASWTALCK